MMAVPGLKEAVSRMTREAGNVKRYNQLRYDAGRVFMEASGKAAGFHVSG